MIRPGLANVWIDQANGYKAPDFVHHFGQSPDEFQSALLSPQAKGMPINPRPFLHHMFEEVIRPKLSEQYFKDADEFAVKLRYLNMTTFGTDLLIDKLYTLITGKA